MGTGRASCGPGALLTAATLFGLGKVLVLLFFILPTASACDWTTMFTKSGSTRDGELAETGDDDEPGGEESATLDINAGAGAAL